MTLIYHYTDKDGYNAIQAQKEWKFVAGKPPGEHPRGAYFTTLAPDTPKLARHLRLPNRKLEWTFCFRNAENFRLKRLRGGRRDCILYSAADLIVAPESQVFKGSTEDWRDAHDDRR